ncbi:7566_t:CDS:10 [Diversispora eburnea]|uniref:Autophagy-related protein 2 n=1 Tax=Diversispora eburnea TaxID=1213867 RepID=A0A9N8ZIR4_9GLOM|nr:7566_t:CDS:10 [Diversispora eburnea]
MYKGWPFSGWGLSINVPSTIQKRLLKFLLKRALGQFLAEELDLDNLEIQLGNGFVHLKELQLNVEVLNDLVTDLPVVITDGRIGGIVANIPWKNIWTCDCVLEIHNLKITAVPEHTKPRNAKVSPEDSHILSSSIHFAGDFLRHEMPPEEDEVLRNSIYHSFHGSTNDLDQSEVLPQQTPVQGVQGGDNGIESIQVLAILIDKLMSNVKIVFKDTCIRLLHHSTIDFNENHQTDSGNLKEYYFDLEIPNISFRDETHGSDDDITSINIGSESVTLPPALSETVKSVAISGLSVWIREALNSEVLSNNQKIPDEKEFVEEYARILDSEDEFYSQNGKKNNGQLENHVYEAMILSCVSEENLIRVTLRPNTIPSIQMDFGNVSSSYHYTQEAMQQANSTQSWIIEGLIKSVTAILTPSQIELIADLVNALSNSKSSLETRSPSSIESDDDFINENTRINSQGRIPDKNQYQFDYRRMTQPLHDDYGMDDLVFQRNTQNSPTLRSEIELRQRKREPFSSRLSDPHVKNSSRENYSYNNYKNDQSSALYSTSPPSNISYPYKSSSSSRTFQQTSSTSVASTINPLPNLIPDRKFFLNKPKENLDMDHLKFEINDFMCQVQSWEHDNFSGSRRRGSSSSSSGHQKNSESDEMLRVTMELSISDLKISEWLKGPSPMHDELKSELSNSGFTLPAFNSYNQLLYFDHSLMNSYNPDEIDFPNISITKIHDTNQHRFNSFRRSSKDSLGHTLSKKAKSAIKVKLKIGNVINEGLFSNSSPSNGSFSDIFMEFEPFHLHLDLRIMDRLEKLSILSIGSNDTELLEENTIGKTYIEQASSQLIIDDLDTQRLLEKTALQKFRLRINCEMIRLWLHCPYLNTSSTQSIINDYSIHSSLLISDFMHINATTEGKSQRASRSINFGVQQHDSDQNGLDLQQNRVKIECGIINVFIKESNDAKCILTVKPLFSNSLPLRTLTQNVPIFPNCEITYRPASAITNRTPYIGSGNRSTPFARTFSTFEGEERANWPVENEEEDILMFKQRTIESSLFVINCNFPTVRTRMTKSAYDTLQILLNDLAIWQPKNNSTSDKFTSSPPPSVNRSNFSGYANKAQRDTLYDGLDSYDSEDFELRRKFEGDLFNSRVDSAQPLRPSLASVVVFMTNVEFVILHDKESDQVQTTRSYQLNMADFRFFTVIKHEGNVHNDQFSLTDISTREKSQILCRTLSKNIKTKNIRPMLSIIMHISLDVDINMKETNLALSVNGVSLNHSYDSQWFEDIVAFLQEPEMKSYLDLPSQFTKLFVTINDTSIDFRPKDFAGRVVFVFDSLKVSSNIIPDSPMFAAKLIVQNLDLMLIDDVKALNEKTANRSSSTPLNVKKFWKSIGLVKIATIDFAEINLRTNDGEIYPHFELELTNENLTIETCADTFQTIINLINQLTPKPHIPTNGNNFLNEKPEEKIYADVLAGLDDEAFVQPQPKDLKSKISCGTSNSNLEFVEEFFAIEGGENDFMEEQQLYAVPSPNAVQNNSKNLDIESYDDIEDTPEQNFESSEKLDFVDDHFSVPNENELNDDNQEISKSLTRVRLRDFNITWKLYDGYDWEHTRNEVLDALAYAKALTNSNSNSAGGAGSSTNEINVPLDSETTNPFNRLSFMASSFRNSDYEGSSQASEIDYSIDDQSDSASQESSRVEDGKRLEQQSRRHHSKLHRSKSSKLEIKLETMNMEFDMFPKDDLIAFRLLLLIRDLEILDNIKTSAWRKFLTHMRPDNDTNPRESKSNMIKIDLQSVRPLPSDLEEFRLKAKLLPLRFYIDQDALNFLIRFFSYQGPTKNPSQNEDDMYFQHFEIQPIAMKLDYKPKHIDYTNLKDGNLVELMNLFHLEAAEMTLTSVKLTGVKGVSRLLEDLAAAWLPHIKSTQVPNFVSGVSPIRSLVNIGSGFSDLILLPIEQYKKDGRIIKGLQKGTQSFAKATTMEAIKFGTKIAVGTQILLEQAEEILSFESNSITNNDDGECDSEDDHDKEIISKYADQPADLNEGIEAAYKSLRQNLGTAAHTIFAVPMEVYEKTGTQGTVKAVIRAVPVAVLKPMIGATEAVSKGLLGLRNTIDPNKKLQMEDKYKRR